MHLIKLKPLTLSLFAFFAIANSSHAQSIVLIPPKVSIGLDYYHEKYQESDESGKIMTETAPMSGAHVQLMYPMFEYSTIKFKGAYARGKTKYVGSYWGEEYGSLVTEGHTRYVVQLSALYSSVWPQASGLKTGLGYNYRQLTDRLDQAGDGGYNRINQLSTVSFSVGKEFKIGTLKFDPDFAIKVLASGVQKSYLNPTITHEQRKGLGFDINFPIIVPMQGKSSISINPYAHYMKIDESKEVVAIIGRVPYVTVEPQNKTTELGISLSYTF